MVDHYSKENCDGRHRFLNGAISIILVIVSLVFVGVGWTLNAANTATGKAENAASDVKIQATKVQDNWEATERQMNALRNDVKEVKTDVKESNKAIMEQLMKISQTVNRTDTRYSIKGADEK